MVFLQNLTSLLKRRELKLSLVILAVFIVVIYIKSGEDEATILAEPQKELVTIITPAEYAGEQTLSVIGSVRAVTEAKITSETSGRIVSVNVELGDEVSAGTVIASVENASERAAVLQAEGVYEAALATAEQSEVGVDEAITLLTSAKNSAVSAYRSAYNTNNSIVRDSIDEFFANPDSKVPGLRISGEGYTPVLNSERVSFEELLLSWQNNANAISNESNLVEELQNAKDMTQRTINFVDLFLTVFSKKDGGEDFLGTPFSTLITSFSSLQSSLITTQNSLDSAVSAINNAEDALKRAQLSASGGSNSAADAQVKQSLGTLRSAQANLEKTIFRTPVSGTVNSIYVRTGDFISSFSDVAIVANNNAFEIITYVSDTEKKFLSVGDSVFIENDYTGVVTQIAPAVDPVTRKTEVRIATEAPEIVNGDTVRITKKLVVSSSNSTITIPLTAVKFDQENGSIFVVKDGKLVAKEVEIGKVIGNSVEIIEGMTFTDKFVVDARGLIDGEEVEVTN